MTESSTSNVSNQSTQVTARDIGFTGEQGVVALGAVAQAYRESLSDLSGHAENVARAGFEFSNMTTEHSAELFDRTAMRAENTLAGITNATRDFAQRAIAGSTGQATPLQTLSAASGTGPSESWLSPGVLVAAAVVIVMLAQGSGKQ